MPYIDKQHRKHYKAARELGAGIFDEGTLNYVLTQICLGYLRPAERAVNYRIYNEIIGALECCKLEFYRRKIAPYENKKIKLNGDVY